MEEKLNTNEWGKWYLHHGFSIMPVGADKKPLLAKWKHLQTTKPTEADLNLWWGDNGKYPHSGIAIITGEISGIVVVDIDPKNGGFDSMLALKASNQLTDFDPKNTPTAHTQSGGVHYYFNHPGYTVHNAANMSPGIDLRGDGGYVVAPPTVGLNGKYFWDDDSFTDGNLELVKPDFPKYFQAAMVSDSTATVMDDSAVAKLLQGTSQGDRVEDMKKLMGHYCGLKLQESEIKQILMLWNHANTPPIPLDEFSYQFSSMYEKWGTPDTFVADSLESDIDDVYLVAGKADQHKMLHSILDNKSLPMKDYLDLQLKLKEDFNFPKGTFGNLVKVDSGSPSSSDDDQNPQQKPVIVPTERIPAAMALLESPGYLFKGLEMMQYQGLVGEEANGLLIFLAGTSRLTDDPINTVPQGDAASGKSTAAEHALSLIPPEEKIVRWGFSPKALLHTSLDFRHKVVLILEMEGSDDADYSIRTLQSEKKISFEVVVKEDGDLTTRTVTTEGPTSFVTTTTRIKIEEQNASRVWILQTDESAEQTWAVIHSMTQPKKSIGNLLEPYHDAQRLLAQVKIETSTDLLRLIANHLEKTLKEPLIRLRRDFLRLRVAIEACALAHQYQREIGPNGGIVPDIRDYYMVYQIVKKPFETALQPATSPNVFALVDALKDLVADNPYEGVNVTSIQNKLGWSESKTYSWLGKAREVGLAQKVGIATYGPADIDNGLNTGIIEDLNLSILPDPEIILDQGPDAWKGLTIINPITGEEITTS